MEKFAETIQTLTRPLVTITLTGALVYLAVTKDGDALTALVALAGVAINSWFQSRAAS